jgi:hypothetical protein
VPEGNLDLRQAKQEEDMHNNYKDDEVHNFCSSLNMIEVGGTEAFFILART